MTLNTYWKRRSDSRAKKFDTVHVIHNTWVRNKANQRVCQLDTYDLLTWVGVFDATLAWDHVTCPECASRITTAKKLR